MLRPASLGLRYATHRELKIEAEISTPLRVTDGIRSFACLRLGTTRVSLGFKQPRTISCKMNILFFIYFPPFDIYISRWSTRKVFQPRVSLCLLSIMFTIHPTSPREIHPASVLITVRPPTSPERLVRRQTIVVTSTKKDLLYLLYCSYHATSFLFFLYLFFIYIYICVYVNVPILYGARRSAISFRFIILGKITYLILQGCTVLCD